MEKSLLTKENYALANTAKSKQQTTKAQPKAKAKASKKPKLPTITAAEVFDTDWPHSYYFRITPSSITPPSGTSYYIRLDVSEYKKGYKRDYYREKFVETKGNSSENKPFLTEGAPSPQINKQHIIKKLRNKASEGTNLIYKG